MSVAPVATKMRVAAPKPSIQLHRPRQAAAQIPTVECCNQAPQLGRVEAWIDLDPKPLSENDPKLAVPHHASCLHRADTRCTILNDFDGNNLLRRSRLCNALTPCIQRMHAQSTRRAKLLAPKPTLLEVRNQTLCFRPAQPALYCRHSARVHSYTSAQRESEWKNGVARTSTFYVGSRKVPTKDISPVVAQGVVTNQKPTITSIRSAYPHLRLVRRAGRQSMILGSLEPFPIIRMNRTARAFLPPLIK